MVEHATETEWTSSYLLPPSMIIEYYLWMPVDRWRVLKHKLDGDMMMMMMMGRVYNVLYRLMKYALRVLCDALSLSLSRL